MNVLSLCSGAGGLELGIRLAVPTATTIAYCERDAAAIEVLAARMEDGSLAPAPVFFDVNEVPFGVLAGRVDCVAAGFPCQPHSLAGNRRGIDDDRWLWGSIWRIVREVRSPLLFVENVPGLLTSGGFDRVIADLAAGGWVAEWDCVPAAAVGAPHFRDRLFLLACADWDGDADDAALADPDGERSQAGSGEGRPRRQEERDDPDIGGHGWGGRAPPEPCVRRVDDGMAAQLDGDRLYVIGNGVVPQAAARAWRTLWERLMTASARPARVSR